MTTPRSLPNVLDTFFTARVVRQPPASPHTIASSRDTFGVRWRSVPHRLHRAPGAFTLAALEAPVLGALRAALADARGLSARRTTVG